MVGGFFCWGAIAQACLVRVQTQEGLLPNPFYGDPPAIPALAFFYVVGSRECTF
jgi:hypothetical protein